MSYRRRKMMASKAKPYDTEVEYIESDGVAYINTGVLINRSTNLEIRYGIPKLHSEAGDDVRYFFAFEPSLGSSYVVIGFLTSENKVRVRWGKSAAKEIAVSKNDILTFTVANNTYINYNETSGNRVTDTTGTTYPATVTLKLMSQNGGRIYFAKIGNLDLIPVRIGQTGYLYDKVSGTLFGNANSSGEFIIGPDK